MTVAREGSLVAYWRARLLQAREERYRGLAIGRLAEDLRAYEHLLEQARPNVVIELGAGEGGGTLWFRDRLEALRADGLIGPDLAVVAVDAGAGDTRAALDAAGARLDGIVLVGGNVLDPGVADDVGAALPAGARCLVVASGAHTEDSTRAALRHYARFVAPGGFLVVEWGAVDLEELRADSGWPRGVLSALDAFVHSPLGGEFQLLRSLELYGVTAQPYGVLRRRGEPLAQLPAIEVAPEPPGAAHHEDGLAAMRAGDPRASREELLAAIRSGIGEDYLNDLGVVTHGLGDSDEAEAIFLTARAVHGSTPELDANLESLRAERRARRGSPP